MITVQITQGKEVLVSNEDYSEISDYNWSYSASTGYAVRKGRKNRSEPLTVHMHRVIIDVKANEQVDHINGNKLDNRRSNLRVASVQKNSFNRKKPKVKCTSQYKGVLKRKNASKWEARIKFNNKAIYLGRFVNEEDAARAYNEAALKYFGDFAKCNEI